MIVSSVSLIVIFTVGDNGEDIALQIRRDHDFMGNGSRLRTSAMMVPP